MQTDLPIWELHSALSAAWREHNRLVVVAPTGSGKTTQVCQMLARDGRVPAGQQIVILQPRRVAARTVARRVAEEMGVELGREVGYQVRFEDVLSADTRIAFVTEGILLRWLHSDPTLSRIGAILFDEFHERNLLGDVALAIVKRLQAGARPDLLAIVMSATLEARPVAAYLGDGSSGCPIFESQGRQYPVDIRYQAWGDDTDVWERAAAKVSEIVRDTTGGDTLVFMPGAYEIARTMEDIRHGLGREERDNVVVLPLHGELSPQDQDRAFTPLPAPYRRVIVATNVAETSVTIPGIRYVVDSGLARIARYDPERGVDTLHVEPISQASADQRAGRAGRIAPGVCHRLWAEAEQPSRPARNTPEIQRTDLAEVVLLLYSLGQTDVVNFDFLDKPQAERVRQAEELLALLGAIQRPFGFVPPSHDLSDTKPEGSTGGHITDTGRQMLRLPMHPRYGRMLIEAAKHECVREVALLAAMVSGRDLFTRLDRNDKMTKRNRERFYVSNQSDFFVLAKAFEHAAQNNFNAKACYSHGINPHAAREVAMAYQQILGLCEQAGLLVGQAAGLSTGQVANLPYIHLTGFVDQLAVRKSSATDEFDLAGGQHGTLMDESAVKRALLVVVSEVREITTRAGDRLTLIGLASAVKPEWLRELNPPGLSERVEYVYDRLNKRVVAGRVLRYQDLLVGGEPLSLADLDPGEVARTLAREFGDQVGKLPQWNHDLKQWLLRVRLVGSLMPELDLPAVNRELIERGLASAWHGLSTLKDAVDRPLLPAFEALLTLTQQAAVAQLAPVTLELAPGKPARIVYVEDGPPEVAIKLDDARRLSEHPAIVGGRQRLRLRMYSADNKPAGATEDIATLPK